MCVYMLHVMVKNHAYIFGVFIYYPVMLNKSKQQPTVTLLFSGASMLILIYFEIWTLVF